MGGHRGGVTQRVRALEAFLADVYGAAHILRDGYRPAPGAHIQPVLPRGGGHRAANGVRVHVAGVDLVRDPKGTTWSSKTTCGRRRHLVRDREPAAMTHVFPSSSRRTACGRCSTSRPACSSAAARRSRDRPTRLWWCSRPAWPQRLLRHVFLARQMGWSCRGRDLICPTGWSPCAHRRETGSTSSTAASTTTTRPVALPPGFAPRLPGILGAARAGNVASPTRGHGVADDKALYRTCPPSSTTTGEKPILATCRPTTWRT